MKVGIPSEVKNNEFRVGITPAGVKDLVANGHEVQVQKGAGLGSGIPDEAYVAQGAKMIDSAEDVWKSSEMIIKVKEPIAQEYDLMQEGQLLFTYLHLAADKPQTEALLDKKVTSIAYEIVKGPGGGLPLLAPMSEIAGRLAPQVGSHFLLKANGGSGVLLGGGSGVRRGKVVVLGGGTAGFFAARVANGMGGDVTVFDVNPARMQYIDEVTLGQVRTMFSSTLSVEEAVAEADLVVGAVLIPGAAAPKLVTNEMVKNMKPGSVLVDIAIDQGGCFEDSHATTHQEPVFKVHDATFYCVANMPGAVPFTSTYALTNATMRYAVALANKGWKEACNSIPGLLDGLSTHAGKLYCPAVGEALGIASGEPKDAL